MANTAVSPSPISSAFSSSSTLSSLRSRNTRPRTLPRRGQIKAAIFASIFTSIARFLGAQAPAEGENGARSPHSGSVSPTHMSDFRMDVGDDGSRDLGLSVECARSSSASMSS